LEGQEFLVSKAAAPRRWRSWFAGNGGEPFVAPSVRERRSLERLGAKVTPFAIYRWEMPEDIGLLHDAVRRLGGRAVDVVLFTSSIKLDHLLEAAENQNLKSELRAALADFAAVASGGPIMTEALRAGGLPVDIVPEHPKMAGIVKAAAEQVPCVVKRKRKV
jgi:uroporphyrinogen-III synthase